MLFFKKKKKNKTKQQPTHIDGMCHVKFKLSTNNGFHVCSKKNRKFRLFE